MRLCIFILQPSCHPSNFCHCEGHEVARGNLSFGVSSFSFVWFLGTRDCRVGAKNAPPRNDRKKAYGLCVVIARATKWPVAICEPQESCHCEPHSSPVIARPRRGRSNLSFCFPIGVAHQRLPRQGKKRPSSQ